MPALRRQRHEDTCELKGSLVYIVSGQNSTVRPYLKNKKQGGRGAGEKAEQGKDSIPHTLGPGRTLDPVCHWTCRKDCISSTEPTGMLLKHESHLAFFCSKTSFDFPSQSKATANPLPLQFFLFFRLSQPQLASLFHPHPIYNFIFTDNGYLSRN